MRSWFALLVAALVAGCPGDGNGDGGVDGSAAFRDAPWDPVMCSQPLPGNCTENELRSWGDCIADACKASYETCYGPQWRAGLYAGACAPFMQCATQCHCKDSNCVNACAGLEECVSCTDAHSCDLNANQCELGCDLFVPASNKTCEDLSQCCPGIADADLRAECFDGVERLRGTAEGDEACTGIYALFSALSTTCE
jgi:hypothetical protein